MRLTVTRAMLGASVLRGGHGEASAAPAVLCWQQIYWITARCTRGAARAKAMHVARVDTGCPREREVGLVVIPRHTGPWPPCRRLEHLLVGLGVHNVPRRSPGRNTFLDHLLAFVAGLLAFPPLRRSEARVPLTAVRVLPSPAGTTAHLGA